MRKLLEDLWYGNIVPQEQYTNHHPDINNLMRIADENLVLFSATLTEEQKKLFQKYENSISNLNNIMERESFIYAFRLGGRFMAETLCK